jgi:hypothetical protein
VGPCAPSLGPDRASYAWQKGLIDAPTYAALTSAQCVVRRTRVGDRVRNVTSVPCRRAWRLYDLATAGIGDAVHPASIPSLPMYAACQTTPPTRCEGNDALHDPQLGACSPRALASGAPHPFSLRLHAPPSPPAAGTSTRSRRWGRAAGPTLRATSTLRRCVRRCTRHHRPIRCITPSPYARLGPVDGCLDETAAAAAVASVVLWLLMVLCPHDLCCARTDCVVVALVVLCRG